MRKTRLLPGRFLAIAIIAFLLAVVLSPVLADDTESMTVSSSANGETDVKDYAWKIVTVDKTTNDNRIKDGGLYTSLAIGNDGRPHISYFSPGWGGVRYATRNGDTWDLATVVGADGTTRTAIALSPITGEPTIIYFTLTGFLGSDIDYGHYTKLNYASLRNVTWEYHQLAISNIREYAVRFDPSGLAHVAAGKIAIGTNEPPKILYYNGFSEESEPDFWYVRRFDLKDISVTEAREPSLALTSTGHPMFAFRTSRMGQHSDLRLIENKGDGSSPITVVDDANNWGDNGYFPSLALDSAGNPHISYRNQNPHDTSNNGLRYAYRSSGTWTLENVDPGDMQWTSLVIDKNDRAYISYEDHANGSLKVASRDRPGDPWVIQEVDTGMVGSCTSVAINPVTGLPAISYHDSAHNALKYAEMVEV